MDQQKDVLKQVVRLGCISEDSVGYSADNSCIAAKQGCKRVEIALANIKHQVVVRELAGCGTQ